MSEYANNVRQGEGDRLRLELHAQSLPKVPGTILSSRNSNPFAIVTLQSDDPLTPPKILGKTETIKNSSSPRWIECFDIDYVFTQSSRIIVEVYDEVRLNTNILMGSAVFYVGEVLATKGNTKAKKLSKGGVIFARITPTPTLEDFMFHVNLCGIKLKNVDGIFSLTDPFFELTSHVVTEGQRSWVPVYRSKHIDNDLNPHWETASISINRLCAGNFDLPIQFNLYHFKRDGKHVYMGNFETTVRGLYAARGGSLGNAFEVKKANVVNGKILVKEVKFQGMRGKRMDPLRSRIHPTQVESTQHTTPDQRLSNIQAGTGVPDVVPAFSLSPHEPQQSTQKIIGEGPNHSFSQPVSTEPSPVRGNASPSAFNLPTIRPKFIDYLAGGCQLELSIAIDFTGSNGDPRIPGTLHYKNRDGSLNDYEKALTAVASIIARYSADKKFPVFGFGAKFNGVIKHCFPIGDKAGLDGITSVIDEYRQVFARGFTMSGPTVLTEVIDYAASAARNQLQNSLRVGKQSFRVLLILTDGAVTDIELTKRSIQAASDAPLSIIIVGIGGADFRPMQFLDDFTLNEEGGTDICDFVEFSKYRNDESGLRRATLSEIPDQLVDFFVRKEIMPLPPVSGSQFSLNPEEADESDIVLTMVTHESGSHDETNYRTLHDEAPFTRMGGDGRQSEPQLNVLETSILRQPAAESQRTIAPMPSRSQSQELSTSNVTTGPPGNVYQKSSNVVYPKTPTGDTTRTAQPRAFYVQVPPDVAAGSQLRIENPFTKQVSVVSIPAGVPPGGKFSVTS